MPYSFFLMCSELLWSCWEVFSRDLPNSRISDGIQNVLQYTASQVHVHNYFVDSHAFVVLSIISYSNALEHATQRLIGQHQKFIDSIF